MPMTSNTLATAQRATLTMYCCFKFIFFSPPCPPRRMVKCWGFWNLVQETHRSDNIHTSVNDVVQSLQLCLTLCDRWTTAQQASLSFTISLSLLKLIFSESVMPSNHLILCQPLLLLPSIFPSIKVFSSELALCIRWPEYWSFSFSISLSNRWDRVFKENM